MKSGRSNLAAHLRQAVLAVMLLTLGAMLVASTAQAETRSLVWKVEGKVLSENETREVRGGETIENAVMEATNVKIKLTCPEGRLAKGAFIANERGQAIGVGTPELLNCKVTGNGSPCTVRSPLIYKPIRTVAALSDNGSGLGGLVLGYAVPQAGAGKEWIEFKFEGSGCKFQNTIATGSMVGSAWGIVGGKETQIELEALPIEATSFLGKVTEPKSIWVWSSAHNDWELLEPTGLKAFDEQVKTTGTGSVSLASGGKFGVAES